MAENIEKHGSVQEVFWDRLAKDSLIHFEAQKKITARMAEIWQNRERVVGEAEFIPAPTSGFFGDMKNSWAVMGAEPVKSEYPYIYAPAIDTYDKLFAVVNMGKRLVEQGKLPTLVTNFILAQQSERDVEDFEGKIHSIDGQSVKGIEIAMLPGIVETIQLGFPRGLMMTDGHGLGLEHAANNCGLPVFTMTSMPLLLNESLRQGKIKNMRSVAVGGDVGSVMLMNYMAELARKIGLETEAIYGEKRSEEVFTTYGQSRIKGAQVLFADDVIVSGRTIFTEVLPKADEYGADSAVVFVPHADLVSRTIENLNKCPLSVTLVIGDTFPVRPEVADTVAENRRLLRINVFDMVKAAARMDSQNLLTDVFTNEMTQVELLRQTGLGIFPPYVERFRTTEGMIQ